MRYWIALLSLSIFSQLSCAFSLDELETQLSQAQVIRGDFAQEKYLRDLPMPLKSQGNYVLSKQQGLLWFLSKPISKQYRINGKGVALNTPDGWQIQNKQETVARQSRIFLAVLQGDRSGLQQDFDLTLTGTADNWRLLLTPRSVFLKQIFQQIEIEGGQLVSSIKLHEVQGDKTVLRFINSQPDQQLLSNEQHDFGV